MSDPERFDGNDGLTLSHLSGLAEPDYRAELAELRAQVRYALDDYAQECRVNPGRAGFMLSERLRALVGPWPHEREAAAEEAFGDPRTWPHEVKERDISEWDFTRGRWKP